MKSKGVKAFTLTGVFDPLETQYLLDTMRNKKKPCARVAARAQEDHKNAVGRMFYGRAILYPTYRLKSIGGLKNEWENV